MLCNVHKKIHTTLGIEPRTRILLKRSLFPHWKFIDPKSSKQDFNPFMEALRNFIHRINIIVFYYTVVSRGILGSLRFNTWAHVYFSRDGGDVHCRRTLSGIFHTKICCTAGQFQRLQRTGEEWDQGEGMEKQHRGLMYQPRGEEGQFQRLQRTGKERD